uniref:Uncharacterized protein n=1 Tax=Lactuca sativa TaxID=4236 RepID=A0A9R1WNS2_LACSA|nr:hypothetical protein LSAT_V11C900498110 [Lactuca sativa]
MQNISLFQRCLDKMLKKSAYCGGNKLNKLILISKGGNVYFLLLNFNDFENYINTLQTNDTNPSPSLLNRSSVVDSYSHCAAIADLQASSHQRSTSKKSASSFFFLAW